MADVYANCVLNIATHNAERPSQRSLTDRERPLMQVPEIWWQGFSNEEAIYRVYDMSLEGDGALLSSTLSSRAWVFQERFLSPWTLHLGRHQIFWECNELSLASEMFLSGISNDLRAAHGHRPFNIKTREHRAQRESDSHTMRPPIFDDAWKWMIGEYSNCNLSFPHKDKLTALSGLAQRLCTLWDDEYIAGFFKSDILWHTLWERYGKATKCAQGPYRAPSWSWASMDGAVIMANYGTGSEGQLMASVINAEAILVDESNPWGAIKAAKLTLVSQLLPVTIMPENFNEPGPPRFTATFQQHTVIFSSCVLDVDDLKNLLLPGSLFAVPIVYCTFRSWARPEGTDYTSETQGLLIQTEPGSDQFQRIGIFGAFGWDPQELIENQVGRRDIEIL